MDNRREVQQYIIWGIASALLNVLLFRILTACGTDYRIANIITLIAVKIFGFFTNKIFVFKTRHHSINELLREIFSFIVARSATFLLDMAGIVIMVEIFRLDSFVSKCIMAAVVVAVNYIFSKRFVFVKKEGSDLAEGPVNPEDSGGKGL